MASAGGRSKGEAAGVGSASPASAAFVCHMPGVIPLAQERVGQSRSGFRYDPPKSRAWKHTVAALVRYAMGEHGPLFDEGPLQLVIVGVRACPVGQHRKRTPQPRRWDAAHVCDADNLAHATMNACTQARLWTDDCQVARLVVERWIGAQGEAPSVLIEVSPL